MQLQKKNPLAREKRFHTTTQKLQKSKQEIEGAS